MDATKRLLMVLLAVPAMSVLAQNASLPTVEVNKESPQFRQWCQLGPVRLVRGESSYATDSLKSAATSETTLSASRLRELCANSQPLQASIARANSEGYVNLYDLYEQGADRTSPETTVYLGTEITTDTPRQAWIAYASTLGSKVWLNGRLLYADATGGAAEKSIALPLIAGSNVLLIKVPKANLGVSATARLHASVEAATADALRRAVPLIARRMIQSGTLNITVPTLPSGVRLDAEVRSASGEALFEKKQMRLEESLDVSGLSRGLYRLLVSAHGTKVEQDFYIGSIDDSLADVKARLQASQIHDEAQIINFQTLLRRLEGVTRRPFVPPNETAAQREFWQSYSEEKALGALSELFEAFGLLARKEEPFRHRTGLHLRGYRSGIDDEIQHYRVFIPSSYRAGAPLPLMVMPVTPGTAEPFIDSYFVFPRAIAETWTKVAESLGMGILWPGYRVAPYGNPLDMERIDEALAAMAVEYNVDASRLYLYGHCGGGLTAAMQVLRHPGRYAAIAFQNPLLHRLKNRYDDNLSYRDQPAYQQWLRETDPLSSLAAVRLPMWTYHDGNDPEHGPLADSVELVELARAAGNKPLFEWKTMDSRDRSRSQFDRFYQEDRQNLTARQMAWMLQQRSDHAGPLNIAREPRTSPLSRVFAESFIVVKGTLGSDAEKEQAARWHKEFCDAWERSAYVRCRSIDDVQLTAAEEARSNLVLIGNPATNAVWARLSDQLPVKVLPNAVSVRDQSWAGQALALQGWISHPTIEGRKIALVGAADLRHAKVGTMELWVDGWFDYAVWSTNEAGRPALYQAGSYSAE